MLLALSVISHQSRALGASSYRIFDEQGGSIGRGQNNEWVLDDPTCQLSSRHLDVSLINGCFVVEDKSSNGTGLNGREALLPRAQRVPIADGDRLFLGDFEILVQVVEHVVPRGHVVDTVAADATRFDDGMRTPTATGDISALFAAWAVPPQTVNAQSVVQVPRVLEIVTQGLIELRDARAQCMEMLRVPLGNGLAGGNNPLLSGRSAEAALQELFGQTLTGSPSPIEAFAQALDTLIQHQGGMLAGLRAVGHQRQLLAVFARAYDEHRRHPNDALNDALNDATIFDNS